MRLANDDPTFNYPFTKLSLTRPPTGFLYYFIYHVYYVHMSIINYFLSLGFLSWASACAIIKIKSNLDRHWIGSDS